MWFRWVLNYAGQQSKILLLVKIQGDSYSFNIAESKYGNQIALSPISI